MESEEKDAVSFPDICWDFSRRFSRGLRSPDKSWDNCTRSKNTRVCHDNISNRSCDKDFSSDFRNCFRTRIWNWFFFFLRKHYCIKRSFELIKLLSREFDSQQKNNDAIMCVLCCWFDGESPEPKFAARSALLARNRSYFYTEAQTERYEEHIRCGRSDI